MIKGDIDRRKSQEWLDEFRKKQFNTQYTASASPHHKMNDMRSFFGFPHGSSSEHFKNKIHGAFVDNSQIIGSLSKTAREMIESGAATKIGYGYAVGYCSGYCVRKMAKLGALLVGGTFFIVQSLAYQGYVKINKDRVKNDIDIMLDMNGDGKIDTKDAELAFYKINDLLSYHLPSGGGFSAGLFMGLKN